MNSAAVDIKDMLVAESSLGLTFATNLFVGSEPTTPDDCVTVYDSSEAPPQLTFQQGEDYFYPSVQIVVRNISYQDGWSLVNSIRDALHGRAGETWNSTYYSLIYCFSGPVSLGWDAQGRVSFSVNFNIQRR